MIATDSLAQPSSILTCWKQQRRIHHRQGARQGLVALSYLTCAPIVDRLIDVTRLVLVVLNDQSGSGLRIWQRVAGYGAAAVPWGVAWGGASRSKFLKDLSRLPQSGAGGLRLDVDRAELLTLALQMDRLLSRHAERPHFPKRQQIQLPRIWAGFRARDAVQLSGEGPEFELACREAGMAPRELFAQVQRRHRGLTMVPLDWVSRHSTTAVRLFADLRSFPKRQVIKTDHVQRTLRGHHGASEFDFVSTRFRTGC